MVNINEKLNYLENTKKLIKEAIINKGINILSTETFRQYVDKINQILGCKESINILESIINNYENSNVIDRKQKVTINSEGYILKNINTYGNINQETTTPNSPSPDNPSPIEVVGDNVNLFDKSTITSGKYIANGTIGTNASYCYSDYIEVGANQKIIWNTSDGSIGTFICYYDKNKTYISGTSSVKNISVETPENCKYVIVSFDMKFLDNAKIEKGTISTSYTSYGNGGIDYKVVGKNLIGINDSTTLTGYGFTLDYNSSTGIYTLEGTTVDNGYIKLYDILEILPYTNLNKKNRIMMYKGDYTLSYKYISGNKTTGTINLMIRDCNDSSTTERYEIAKFGTENRQLQFTVDENYLTQKYIWFAKGITFTDFKFTMQLERGSILTEHEPYKEKNTTIELPENEFLAKIGDYEDYIDNKGLLNKYIGKLVLTGTETWTKNGSSNLYYCNDNVLNNIKLQVGNTTLPYLICSHFKADTVDNVWNKQTDNTITVFTDGTANPRICTSKFETLDAFKSYLAEQYANGTPVEIYYVLATPYTVSLADEQKEKYLSLPLFEGINNVETSAEISFEYSKNIKDILNEIIKIYEGEVQ